MKKSRIRFLLLCLTSVLPVSCLKEKQAGTDELYFTVSAQTDTKVAFGTKSGSVYPLVWSVGDRINVNGVSSSGLTSADAGKKSAQFTVTGVTSPYTIIHPASAYSSAGEVKFASEQTHKAGSCPLASTVLSCKTTENNSVELDNMCGYLRLNISRAADNTQFSRIEFSGNAGEDVAGVFAVTYDQDGHPVLGAAKSGKKIITLSSISETGEYIITIPAITFAKGFKVDVIDVNNHYMRIKTNKSIQFLPGILVNAPAATYVPNGTIIGGNTPEASDLIVHTAIQMNTDVVENSHAGEELSASLQPMYKYSQLISNTILEPELYSKNGYEDQKYATYPRIKRMADGRFIMFYHGGKLGSRVWYVTSSDYLNWSTPKLLFEPVKYTEPAELAGDYRVFVNPDAVVLDNGDLLMVCSYRAKKHYSQDIDGGLAFRRSSDNGNSWTAPMYVDVGNNWEAYILKLNDGTLQCYYTDAIAQTRNSGIGMITSTDGGFSWSSPIRVCQRYKYIYQTEIEELTKNNGQVIYTDQMPCFRQLNDGSLVGIVEDRIEKTTPTDCGVDSTYDSYYSMSLVYNNSTVWTDLTNYTSANPGPSDRTQIMKYGSGGYAVTFKSGEVVFSWTTNFICKLNLTNNTARSFKSSDWSNGTCKPFAKKGYWPCMESCYGNCLALAMHSQADVLSSEFKADEYPGMQVGMMYLNHRIDAASETIIVDGNAREWQTTQALYVSAPSGEEAILRAAYDATNMYLAVEVEDDARNTDNYVHVNLAYNNVKKVGITFNCNAVYEQGTTSGVTVMSSKGTTNLGKKGFVYEICVPLSLVGATSGSDIKCYMDLKVNNTLYPFAETTASDISSWKIIKLQ